jgi:hypothetical protein
LGALGTDKGGVKNKLQQYGLVFQICVYVWDYNQYYVCECILYLYVFIDVYISVCIIRWIYIYEYTTSQYIHWYICLHIPDRPWQQCSLIIEISYICAHERNGSIYVLYLYDTSINMKNL